LHDGGDVCPVILREQGGGGRGVIVPCVHVSARRIVDDRRETGRRDDALIARVQSPT